MFAIKICIVFLVAYLIGSIPTGFIIVKLFKGQDIRTIGSGSTGATNVKRVMGTKWFFIVMLLVKKKGTCEGSLFLCMYHFYLSVLAPFI